MSALPKFEASARAIWNSKLKSEEKAEKLNELHGMITRYLVRVDDMREANSDDPYTARAFARTRSYLAQLAEDVEYLSGVTEKAPGKRRVLTTSSRSTSLSASA